MAGIHRHAWSCTWRQVAWKTAQLAWRVVLRFPPDESIILRRHGFPCTGIGGFKKYIHIDNHIDHHIDYKHTNSKMKTFNHFNLPDSDIPSVQSIAALVIDRWWWRRPWRSQLWGFTRLIDSKCSTEYLDLHLPVHVPCKCTQMYANDANVINKRGQKHHSASFYTTLLVSCFSV